MAKLIEKFEKINTPNARLFYLEAPSFELDYSYYYGQLINSLEQINELKRANSRLYLYFFLPSNDELFNEEDFWIGIDVLGYYEPDEEAEYALFDTEISETYSFPVVSEGAFSLTFQEIFEKEKKCREMLGKTGQKLADTWRVTIEDIVTPNADIRLEFFEGQALD